MGSSDLPPSNGIESNDYGMAIKISSEVIVAAVIFLFLLIIFFFFLYIYMKKIRSGSSTTSRRSAEFIFAAGEASMPSRGLNVAVLRSLPLTVYKRSDFKGGLECSVCLCELSDGEHARLLPKCNHGFHLACIDMWFQSHSTCPLCRCLVGPETDGEARPLTTDRVAADGHSTPELAALPTNVLFFGNHGRVNTRRSFTQDVNSSSSANSVRTLVVSLPNRLVDGLPSPISPLPSSRFPMENMKSPVEAARSPGESKLSTFRRLLSRGKRAAGSSCTSPVGGDIEQGLMDCGAINREGCSKFPKTSATSKNIFASSTMEVEMKIVDFNL